VLLWHLLSAFRIDLLEIVEDVFDSLAFDEISDHAIYEAGEYFISSEEHSSDGLLVVRVVVETGFNQLGESGPSLRNLI
jgi:hypothetical protein